MLAFLLASALASPLNPWGSATAPGAALVNPYLYVTPDAVNPLVYGSVGLSEHADVYFGYGELLPTAGGGVGTVEFFPRYFVVPQLALTPHLYWTPGVDGVTVAREVHLNLAAGRFSFVANAGWRQVIHARQLDPGTVPVILAPEVKLTDALSVYVEVDPTFSLQGDAPALQVVPGFGLSLDPEGRQTVSVGLQVPVLPGGGPASVGLWYCVVVPATGS